jgi:single-strand DNA-binding protein
MADGLNRVMLIGNLGADPIHRVTANNKDVTDIRIATTESWRGEDGNRNQATEWHKIVIWGRTAISVRDNLKKGSQVYIEGKIKTRKWTDNENRDRYSTEIVANKVLFLGGRRPLDSAYGNAGDEHGGNQGMGGGNQFQPANNEVPTDDDIPF